MEILTGAQMRGVDRRAIELGTPARELMENAGRGVARRLVADYPELAGGSPAILCGKGNNGGDGLVVARYLARAGWRPLVVLLAGADALAGDARTNFDRARDAGIEIHEVPDAAGWSAIAERIGRAPLVVDALLGTGVRGGARGLVGSTIDALNGLRRRVVSIDLPSGLGDEPGDTGGPVVRAHRTYTLCRPKLPLVVGSGSELAGRCTVVPIGIPDELVTETAGGLIWCDARAASALLPERRVGSHKGTFGHLLVFAGAAGKTGAAVLAGRAALRSGVGLVTVATGASQQPLVAAQQAELMTEALPEAGGVLAEGAAARVIELAGERDAVALGPGLGTSPQAVEAVREVSAKLRQPLVIDADGLNALAGQAGSRDLGARPCVLTPHPGEAGRLLETATADVQADRLSAARLLAERTGAVVVLKGHRSIVTRPDGTAWFNGSGNPGMATAGTGDVLTGVVGALLARGLDAWDAARLGAFVHGAAGDLAAATLGEDGMIASDVIQRLPGALVALGNARR